MTTKVTPVKASNLVVAGDDYAYVLTLTKGGATYDVTGATVTCSIRERGSSSDIVADHAITLTTPASGIVTLTLTDGETATLSQSPDGDHLTAVEHVADVKVVESGGTVVRCGPFTFNVRRPIT